VQNNKKKGAEKSYRHATVIGFQIRYAECGEGVEGGGCSFWLGEDEDGKLRDG
jgi:hypothetical protein